MIYTDFKIIQDFVDKSNLTNSNTDKMDVLKIYTQHESVRKALIYTYDTFKQYGITSSNCKKNQDLLGHPNTYGDFFLLLDDLNNRVITGHNAIANVNRYVLENPLYKDLIWNIIDRNLKTRSTASMINKVWPGLIPTFDVALANPYNDKTAKKVDWNDKWFVSRKLDGVRCITIIDNAGDVKFFSRAGNEFTTLERLKIHIESLGLSNQVLDGEICIVDDNGDEDFSRIIKEIKKKDHTISNPFYFMFDMLQLDDFLNKTSADRLSDRLFNLAKLVPETTKFMSVLPQYQASDEVFDQMVTESKKGNWEGLMLRKDAEYQGKRSMDILKVKSFSDAEYIVLDIETALQRVIVNGLETEEEMLKNIVIEHKGNRVDVGSGFSQEQRRHYFKNPNEIIGKQVTVQYFEESQNKKGEYSLRFPVIKTVYETPRDI